MPATHFALFLSKSKLFLSFCQGCFF